MEYENMTKTQLLGELRVLQDALADLEISYIERGKTINCLYGISGLFENSNTSTDQLIQGTVNQIPLAYQHPEAAFARIRLYDKEYKSRYFRETSLVKSANIVTQGVNVGTIEVFFTENEATNLDSARNNGEKSILTIIAKWLGIYLESKLGVNIFSEQNGIQASNN